MSVFEQRYRGFRIVNFLGVAVLLTLMLGVYWAKTRASMDSASIDRIERQIRREEESIRGLRAQVAGLEAPDRIARLSEQRLGMAALKPAHETAPADLAKTVGVHTAPPAPATPAPAVPVPGAPL